MISKDNKAYVFRICIPIINSHFGEHEDIKHVNCSWKRILKIASYYSKFGLATIYWDNSNLLLWAGCKHKRLPIPFSQHDVEEANREWDKIVCELAGGEEAWEGLYFVGCCRIKFGETSHQSF